MKNLPTISKALQIVVLVSFFLPFFPKGCESKQAENTPAKATTIVEPDNTAIDTTTALVDTCNIDTAVQTVPQNASKNTVEHDDGSLSSAISKNVPALKPVLRPSDNFSGLGMALDIFQYFQILGVAFALLLFVVGLIIKLRDFNSAFHITNILALFFLTFAQSSNVFYPAKLWGYWVCLCLSVGLVIYDTFLILKGKQLK